MSDLFSEALHDERSFFLVLFGAKFFLWHPVCDWAPRVEGSQPVSTCLRGTSEA
jgi:hypothetical protein